MLNYESPVFETEVTLPEDIITVSNDDTPVVGI